MELVVLSHLRWDFVWQRPQQLVSRIAPAMERTWFLEEPMVAAVREPVVRSVADGPVTRVWLEVPGPARHCYFDDPAARACEELLARHIGRPAGARVVWVYTPTALPLVPPLGPSVVVYDVMDDLSAFAFAPPSLLATQRALLERADVVFTGGRSLHASVAGTRTDALCFPSGVDPDHFARARALRRPGTRPVAGYVGVIDERIDLQLVADLAAALDDWEIHMVGPVAKISPADLPSAPNLVFTGPRPYDRLPKVMAGFDVALMPFAINAATRSISPTKTLEYLAAGLPVVSTRVPDVVADFADLVDLRVDGAGFADACREVLRHDVGERDRRVAPVLARRRWDAIAARMLEHVRAAAEHEPLDPRQMGRPA